MRGLELFKADSYYHIVNHAVGFDNLFREEENYYYFLKRYSYYMPSVCRTLAYCLMPNHIHILIKTHKEKELVEHPKYHGDVHKLIMQPLSNLLNSYAKAYNKRYKRRGALWIDGTKRFLIDDEDYLTSVIRYIHQNPVKHGFTKKIEEWTFSSYQQICLSESKLVSTNEILSWFGGKGHFIHCHTVETSQLVASWEY